jgi:hypothetical protein
MVRVLFIDLPPAATRLRPAGSSAAAGNSFIHADDADGRGPWASGETTGTDGGGLAVTIVPFVLPLLFPLPPSSFILPPSPSISAISAAVTESRNRVFS